MEMDLMQPFTQFGAAGLMGALWLCERMLARKRETQLSETHDRIIQQRQELSELVLLIQRNTAAFERFEQTQIRLNTLLERMHDEQTSTA